jgi:hypothetical protein
MDQLNELARQLPYSNYVIIAIGAAVLLAGRKLYWLAVGGLGFVAGLYLVNRYMAGMAFWTQVAIAVVVGIVGAFLTVLAQRIAISLAGIIVGASLVNAICQPFAVDLDTGIWWLTFLGAVLGLCFAAFLFEATVVVVTSCVGAVLILGSVVLAPAYKPWAFLGLVCLGLAVQSRQEGLSRRPEH